MGESYFKDSRDSILHERREGNVTLTNSFGGDSYKTVLIECPECENEVAIFDMHRCEVFCKDCGLVLMYNPPHNHGIPALEASPFNIGTMERSVLNGMEADYDSKGSRYNHVEHIHTQKGRSTSWRRKQYHRFVRVFHTNIWMSPYQKRRAHFVIDSVKDFRRLHYLNDYTFLVSAICVFCIEETNPNSVSFDHPFLKEVGLSREEYSKIENKIRIFL